jgi:hypothetical protein
MDVQDSDIDFVLRRGIATVEPEYLVGPEENL